MPPQTTATTPPIVIALTTLLTLAIVTLFGLLMCRSFYRSVIGGDKSAFYRLVYINDSLDRMKQCVVNEAASWSNPE